MSKLLMSIRCCGSCPWSCRRPVGRTQDSNPQRHHASKFFHVQFGPSEQLRAVCSRFRRKNPVGVLPR